MLDRLVAFQVYGRLPGSLETRGGWIVFHAVNCFASSEQR
jgi:hypothetical protein